jgi:parallel beta-helix repeat protein
MKIKAGLTVLLLTTVLVAFGAGQALAATFVVDDDLAQCPGADFTDIQSAVNAAAPGDDIRVCPGIYSSTTVDKQLRLMGSTNPVNESECLDPAGDPGNDPAQDSIVQGAASAPGFLVAADGVEIRSFTVKDAANDAGIRVPNTVSGTVLRLNVVRDNTIGVNLQSNGVTLTSVDHNCIRRNNVTGSAAGTGVYSDAGLKNAGITLNTFFDHDEAGITLLKALLAGPLELVEVALNSSKADANFVNITDSTDSAIHHNRATGTDVGSAVDIRHGNSGLIVQHNDLRLGADEGIHVFVDPTVLGATVNTGLDISFNVAVGNATHGLNVRPNSLTSSLISHNMFQGNGDKGIWVRTGSGGNTFQNNDARGNTGVDCQDDTTGGGTSATANTWVNNKGNESMPAGICKKTGKP